MAQGINDVPQKLSFTQDEQNENNDSENADGEDSEEDLSVSR